MVIEILQSYKDYEISQTLLKLLSHVITVMSDTKKGSHFNRNFIQKKT